MRPSTCSKCETVMYCSQVRLSLCCARARPLAPVRISTEPPARVHVSLCATSAPGEDVICASALAYGNPTLCLAFVLIFSNTGVPNGRLGGPQQTMQCEFACRDRIPPDCSRASPSGHQTIANSEPLAAVELPSFGRWLKSSARELRVLMLRVLKLRIMFLLNRRQCRRRWRERPSRQRRSRCRCLSSSRPPCSLCRCPLRSTSRPRSRLPCSTSRPRSRLPCSTSRHLLKCRYRCVCVFACVR